MRKILEHSDLWHEGLILWQEYCQNPVVTPLKAQMDSLRHVPINALYRYWMDNYA